MTNFAMTGNPIGRPDRFAARKPQAQALIDIAADIKISRYHKEELLALGLLEKVQVENTVKRRGRKAVTYVPSLTGKRLISMGKNIWRMKPSKVVATEENTTEKVAENT